MGTKNLYMGFTSTILLAIISNSKATEQLLTLQRGTLVRFEENQQLAQGQRQHAITSFQVLEHPHGSPQPFRFDETPNNQEDHRNPQPISGLDNHQNIPIFGEVNTVNYPGEGTNGVKAGIKFQDDNEIEEQKVQKKRKKRRRRRPRLQQLPILGAYLGGYPTTGTGYPILAGSGYPTPGFGYQTPGNVYPASGSRYPVPGSVHPSSYVQNPYGNPAFAPGFQRPLRRPRPQSFTSDALSAVTGALTSIARYDDYQCVPRLLCEAAGGGALGAGAPSSGAGSGLLQSVAALQPLLSLLSGYNGISASPLFIFGRAVFLGMTSRGGLGSTGAPAICRYAYPLCPTDPEQLVYYLNNHKGGFFRFFNAPQPPNPQYGLQQNLEQFYNQLVVPGQNQGQYGFYQPPGNFESSAEQHGLQNGQSHLASGAEQGYGLYNGFPNQQYDTNYQKIPTINGLNYGANYPYSQHNYGFAKVGLKNSDDVESNKIEERIQNGKTDLFEEDNFNSKTADRNKHSKWLFPHTHHNDDNASNNDQIKKENNLFSFPKDNDKTDFSGSNRKAKGFFFPGAQSNREFDVYAYEETTQKDAFFDNFQREFQTEAPKDEHEEGVETVYIVRGDGDPENPEIVKLRPGQTIQSLGYL